MGIHFKEDLDRYDDKYSVSDETIIFRYMNFSKFIDLLENRNLFFCNSQCFEDEYEGTAPIALYKNRCEQDVKIHEDIQKLYKAYINCWNYSNNESYALWKIYTNLVEGVAIKSTIGNLKRALSNENIKIYKVEYLESFDDENKNLTPPYYIGRKENNEIGARRKIIETYKLNAYEYEKEIRAVYLENSKENGIPFDVDLKELINEIYISPFAPTWFYELIIKIVDRYEISDKTLIKSNIKLR